MTIFTRHNRRVSPASVTLMCIFIVSVAGMAHRAHAASQQFYGLANISHFSKPVISLREKRFTHLVEQKFDFSCGAAAVTTILRYAYNMDITELDTIKGLSTVSDPELVKQRGYSLLDIRSYVETLGLRGRGYKISAATLDALRIPTIALLEIRGYSHFVVLRRTEGDTVYIGDPALGNQTMSREDFIDGWNGTIFAVFGTGFNRDTVLAKPEPALSAHTLLLDQSPISNSELLDFGFHHAELF